MTATASPVRAGVDVGGTFTDLVAVRDGVLVTAKVASTPHDQSLGVRDVLASGALGPSVALAHGTTIATNALLERRGARVGLITTEGFRDIVEIGRQNRPSLYDLTERRPEALVPSHLRFTVRERIGPSGVVTPLDEASVAETIERLRAAEVDAVAICLLFSFVDPSHEDRIAALVRAALPSVHISVSSQVLPEFRASCRSAPATCS
jgi:N-methylhydantoinase A